MTNSGAEHTPLASAHVRQDGNRPVLTERQAAQAIECSRRQLQYVWFILRYGIPELVDAVRIGEISVRAGADLARLPEQIQRDIMAKGKAEVRRAVAEIRKASRNTVKDLLNLWNKASGLEQMVFLAAIGIVKMDNDGDGDDGDDDDDDGDE